MVEVLSPAPQTFPELKNRLKSVLSKRAGAALGLWGEAGIGKSWTAQQLLWQTPCKNLSVQATASLAALVEALPRPRQLPLWAERSLERLERGEALETKTIVDSLAALLSASAPTILHAEDLHETSPERLELWRNLARMVERSKGVALLATSRTAPPEPFETHRIEPLDVEASRALLKGEVGLALPVEAVDWVFGRARGNPLFTLEYLRFLTRQGHLWNDGHKWRWREPPADLMPTTVEALIEQQILGASAEANARRALEARAILPLDASEDLWAAVAGLEARPLEDARIVLVHRGILRGEGFAHPLFREVRLRTLRPERKQTLARRALEALWDDPQAAALYVDDAGLEPAQALELLRKAAEGAEQGGDGAGAARLLAQAVKYAGEEAGPLALQAAKLLRPIDQKSALELAEQATNHLHTPEALYLLAELLAVQGRMTEVEQVLSRLPATEREGTGWPARLLVLKALVGDFAGAVGVWRAYPALQATYDPEVLYQASFSHSATGDSKTGLEIAERTLGSPSLTPELLSKLHSAIGGAYYYQADYARANQSQAEAQRLARESRSPKAIAHIAFNRSYTLGLLGRYDEMRQCLEEARKSFGEIGEAKRYAHAGITLSQLHLLAANYVQAEETLLESRSILSRMDPSESFVDCEKNLGQLYWSWRPPHGKALALKHANSALQTARLLKSPRNLMSALVYAAYTETWQSQAERGLEMVEEALAIAEQLGHPWGRMFATGGKADALKGLGRLEEAQKAYAQAQTLAQTLHLDLESQTLGLELDRFEDDIVRAAERLRWFKEKGAEHHVRLALRLFPELAEASAPAVQAGPRLGGIRASSPSTSAGAARRLEMLGVLGPLQFAGEPVKGRKRQELLALLLEARLAGRGEVNRLELVEALYPDADEIQASGSLKEVVHQVRSALGQGVITTTPGGYALGAAESDAEAFLGGGDTRLWRGAYLADLSLGRDESVREALYQVLRLKVAELLGSDPKEAARVSRILLGAEPYDSEALKLALRALRADKNPKALKRLYERARIRMLEVGERLPESWAEYVGHRPKPA